MVSRNHKPQILKEFDILEETCEAMNTSMPYSQAKITKTTENAQPGCSSAVSYATEENNPSSTMTFYASTSNAPQSTASNANFCSIPSKTNSNALNAQHLQAVLSDLDSKIAQTKREIIKLKELPMASQSSLESPRAIPGSHGSAPITSNNFTTMMANALAQSKINMPDLCPQPTTNLDFLSRVSLGPTANEKATIHWVAQQKQNASRYRKGRGIKSSAVVQGYSTLLNSSPDSGLPKIKSDKAHIANSPNKTQIMFSYENSYGDEDNNLSNHSDELDTPSSTSSSVYGPTPLASPNSDVSHTDNYERHKQTVSSHGSNIANLSNQIIDELDSSVSSTVAFVVPSPFTPCTSDASYNGNNQGNNQSEFSHDSSYEDLTNLGSHIRNELGTLLSPSSSIVEPPSFTPFHYDTSYTEDNQKHNLKVTSHEPSFDNNVAMPYFRASLSDSSSDEVDCSSVSRIYSAVKLLPFEPLKFDDASNRQNTNQKMSTHGNRYGENMASLSDSSVEEVDVSTTSPTSSSVPFMPSKSNANHMSNIQNEKMSSRHGNTFDGRANLFGTSSDKSESKSSCEQSTPSSSILSATILDHSHLSDDTSSTDRCSLSPIIKTSTHMHSEAAKITTQKDKCLSRKQKFPSLDYIFGDGPNLSELSSDGGESNVISPQSPLSPDTQVSPSNSSKMQNGKPLNRENKIPSYECIFGDDNLYESSTGGSSSSSGSPISPVIEPSPSMKSRPMKRKCSTSRRRFQKFQDLFGDDDMDLSHARRGSVTSNPVCPLSPNSKPVIQLKSPESTQQSTDG